MVDGNTDGSQNGEGAESREQAKNQEPAANNFRECSDVGECNWKRQVKRADKGVGEIFNICKFFITMMNEQRPCEHSQHQQPEIKEKRFRKDDAKHRKSKLLYKS